MQMSWKRLRIFNEALEELIRRTIREHKRIIFNGNNYSDEWVKEAKSGDY